MTNEVNNRLAPRKTRFVNIPEAKQITLLQAHLTAKGVRATIPQVGPPSKVFCRLRHVNGAP